MEPIQAWSRNLCKHGKGPLKIVKMDRESPRSRFLLARWRLVLWRWKWNPANLSLSSRKVDAIRLKLWMSERGAVWVQCHLPSSWLLVLVVVAIVDVVFGGSFSWRSSILRITTQESLWNFLRVKFHSLTKAFHRWALSHFQASCSYKINHFLSINFISKEPGRKTAELSSQPSYKPLPTTETNWLKCSIRDGSAS